jgi:copper chaperone CopZ
MKGIFKIAGMTCQGCANTIEDGLKNDPNIIMATVSLDDMELTTQSTIPLDDKYVDSIISSLGNYKVQNRKKNLLSKISDHFNSKKPIVLGLLIVTISSLSLQTSHESFTLDNWFMSYMGVFFMLFSFLKLLNVQGFSTTFSRYDYLAKTIPGFAICYPCLELFLGIAFLTQTFLIAAGLITLIVMVSQSIGVANVLRTNQTIQCACLGTAISLPVSYLTLFENLVMILMSAYMISKLTW